MLSPDQLTGHDDTHVVGVGAFAVRLHPDAAAAFFLLRKAAAADGIDLVPASAYRSFDQQLAIWNAKYRGERPLYGEHGETLNRSDLDEQQTIECILRWSALPGASRHHWGTDLDVIDRAAMPEGYSPALMVWEYEPDGVFAALGRWLDENLAASEFFRPYQNFLGGVQREPWHLSFAPIATQALADLDFGVLRDAVTGSQILGLNSVIEQLPEIHRRYVTNVCRPDAQKA